MLDSVKSQKAFATWCFSELGIPATAAKKIVRYLNSPMRLQDNDEDVNSCLLPINAKVSKEELVKISMGRLSKQPEIIDLSKEREIESAARRAKVAKK